MAIAKPMTDTERMAIALEYLKAFDNAGVTESGGSILELFAEDAQVYFPKWGVAKGRDEIGRMFGDVGGDEKCGGELEMREQPEQARHAGARAVFALRHQGAAAGERGVLRESGRFAVNIEAKHRRATIFTGPDETRLRREAGRGGWAIIRPHRRPP